MKTITYTCCKETKSCQKLGAQKKELSDLSKEFGYDVVTQISENLQSMNAVDITQGMKDIITSIENNEIDALVLDIQDYEHSNESIIKLCDACIRNQVSIDFKSDLQEKLVMSNQMNMLMR